MDPSFSPGHVCICKTIDAQFDADIKRSNKVRKTNSTPWTILSIPNRPDTDPGKEEIVSRRGPGLPYLSESL